MRVGKFLAAALIVSAGIKIAAMAQQTPAADDATAKGKLFAPYSLLTDLSSDQKSKIEDIHKNTLAEEKKLLAKEHDDINGVLSDSQKKELSDLEAKASMDRRASDAERRAASEEQRAKDLRDKASGMTGGATTQP